MIKYCLYEKIDIDFLSSVTGLSKELIKEIFTTGDCFRIGEKKYKICQAIKEDDKKVYLCQVWQ